MENAAANESYEAARNMVDAFASIGAAWFDITLTTCMGEKDGYQRAVSYEETCQRLPELLDVAERQQLNVILRPLSPPVLLQLDDLDFQALERVRPVSFLSLETSLGNYQAWIALLANVDEDFSRRLKKGVGADLTASGAARIAGSLNFKTKYAPDFPRVAISHITPDLLVSARQLDDLDVVAAPEMTVPTLPRISHPNTVVKKWPSYELCLAGAPLNHEGTAPDKSRADFTFCMIAIDWGWSLEETAVRLLEESAKAMENGDRYAIRTAKRAAEAVARRRL